MRKISWFLGTLIFLLGAAQYSMAGLADLTLLKNIDVAATADNTRIEFSFNRTPVEHDVAYRDNFLQLEFPGSYIDPAKQWVNVEDTLVENIFAYQFDKKTVRVRLFTSGNIEDMKDNVRLSRDGNNVVILYDQRPVNMDTGSETGNPPPGVRDPEHVILNGAANREQGALSPQPLSTKTPADIEPLDISASFFKMIIALGIVLSLLLFALFLFKKMNGKKISLKGSNEDINVITSAYIGPKKSIALVEISGERIVVGITPDNISMLTKLGEDGEFRDILKQHIPSNGDTEPHDELWEKV